eukprot:264904-Prorocentrum_minimum.AAC.1
MKEVRTELTKRVDLANLKPCSSTSDEFGAVSKPRSRAGFADRFLFYAPRTRPGGHYGSQRRSSSSANPLRALRT